MKLLENKIIRLVEERGYMGTKYIPVIKEIISYIQNYIQTNPKNKNNSSWEFMIPYTITEKIDCVDNLVINITIEDKEDGYKYSGAGSNVQFINNKIVDGKLEMGKISIFGFSRGTNLFPHTIFNSLSHELNHLFELYERLKKRNNSNIIYARTVNQNQLLKKTFSNDKVIDDYIKRLFYRLLFKSELNALINGVYGDLETLNSNRENFNSHIKYTQAYYVYQTIRDNLHILNTLSDEEWENIIYCFNITKADNAKGYADVNQFKKRFKAFIIYKLNTLIKGIGKVASFYYDSKEENNYPDSITINSNPNTKLL